MLPGFGLEQVSFFPESIDIIRFFSFPVLNLLNMGFLVGDETTSSNSILLLLIVRVFLYEGWIYLLLLIQLYFLRLAFFDVLSIRALLIFNMLLYTFIVYSLLGLQFGFFSMRQSLPFYSSFVFLFLIFVFEIREFYLRKE